MERHFDWFVSKEFLVNICIKFKNEKNQLHLCIDNVYDFISTHHDTRFYEKLSIRISWYFHLSWACHVKILTTTTPQVDRKCHISLIKIKKYGLMVYIYLLSIDLKPKTFNKLHPKKFVITY